MFYGWHDQSAQEYFDHLRLFQAISAGVDYHSLAVLSKHQVLCANTSGIHAEPMSVYVLCVLLQFSRGIHSPVRAGRQMWTFRQQRPPKSCLKGQTAVILCTGHIGSTMSTKYYALGLQLLCECAHGRPAAGL